MISKKKITLTSDSSGDAAEVFTIPSGYLESFTVEIVTTPTASWDLTVTNDEGTVIWTNAAMSNSADAVVYPRVACVDATNTGITNSYSRVASAGSFTFTGAAMGSAKVATVTVYYSSV